MRAVLQVAKPRFQSRRIVFPDGLTVSDNVGFAGDRGPFAGGIEEGDVDLGFGLEIIGFAGLGVGVEKEVNAATFLRWRKRSAPGSCGRQARWAPGSLEPTLAAKAMHLDVRRPLLSIRVVIMPNLQDCMKVTRSSTFSFRSGFVRFVAL